MARWLEAANGGKFEWGTGEDEKKVQDRRAQAAAVAIATASSRLKPTSQRQNINVCLFGDGALFRQFTHAALSPAFSCPRLRVPLSAARHRDSLLSFKQSF